MSRRLDLEQAAARAELRGPHWRTQGIETSSTREGETGEYLVVRFTSPSWHIRLVAVADEGRWTDLHFVSPTHTVRERRRIASADAWGTLLDEAAARASRIRLQPARLLARTCTTGWLDWIHGELWLLPDALVRVRSGLLDSTVNSVSGSIAMPRDPYTVTAYDPEAILAGHRTNKVIDLAGIDHARLHGGVTTSGLTAHMTDGTHHKLLWNTFEPTRRLLRDRLLPVLGPRLTH
ncbi:hypothetical protein [Streptomyces tauricus]|uniref:hypothetical protein n=1 Tax=Streptomyces tauricus TaxID=68274 RepID=UPI0022436E29|nr:hypothetical protein [Streptomyces tauricus]MCW8097472.1 hypothetical protein [Streptomyces tauricus]